MTVEMLGDLAPLHVGVGSQKGGQSREFVSLIKLQLELVRKDPGQVIPNVCNPKRFAICADSFEIRMPIGRELIEAT